MFPSEWSGMQSNNNNITGKKRKANPQKREEDLKSLLLQCEIEQAAISAQNVNPDYDDSIIGTIKRQINNSRFAPATPEELQLDHVLSSVPYRDMLESLFGTITSGPPPNLPIITKAYEEAYMREAGPGERQCAMGSKCECMFIDYNAPFIAVKFDLPNEPVIVNPEFRSESRSESKPESKPESKSESKPESKSESKPESKPESKSESNSKPEPKLCVLCSRKTTQKLFYDTCYSGKRVLGLIQRYGNLCNQPGEYARDCMLICPPSAPWHCLPLPIMSHQRNRYRVQIVAGVKHLQQMRVSHEDFFVSPSVRSLLS